MGSPRTPRLRAGAGGSPRDKPYREVVTGQEEILGGSRAAWSELGRVLVGGSQAQFPSVVSNQESPRQRGQCWPLAWGPCGHRARGCIQPAG